MAGEQQGEPCFNIGIAMAGAVSGGAYSAGVLDFLMEALNEWQKQKDDPNADVPRHVVFISAVSGTSAGGITAALGLASLAAGIGSVEEPSVDPASPPIRRVLPPLYDVWVKKLRLFGSREVPVDAQARRSNPTMLDTGDIKPGLLPDSVLNSDVLTQIARESLISIDPKGQRYAFFTNPTHLFLTHTNLDGIPYPIEFAEGGKYTMMLHEGRAHFAVSGLGSREFPQECRWLDNWGDGGEPLNLDDLAKLKGAPSDQPLPNPFESLAQATLTTSAFPFGFSARPISLETAKMRSRAMTFEAPSLPRAPAKRGRETLAAEEEIKRSTFVCIDGGALNNEPFDLVRWTIRNLDESQNSRDPATASRAVILIAPFPPAAVSDLKLLALDKRDLSMSFIGMSLLPALMNQARFKVSDLVAAADPKVYSRYLISPSRPGAGEIISPSGEDAKVIPVLASNQLYAFAGFLDEQFREHDFQLGRRNCQQFLRAHFVLHPSNPVFGAARDSNAPPGATRPIIPLVGRAAPAVEERSWPKMPRHRLAELRIALQARLDPLAAAIADKFLEKYAGLRFAARLSWWRNRRRLVNFVLGIIEAQLSEAGQLDSAPEPDFWTRLWRSMQRPRVRWLLIGLALLVALIIAIYDS
jgi:hypothetical protein